MFGFLTKGMIISKRKLLAVIILFSTSFAWFFVFYDSMNELISPGISTDSFVYNASIVSFLIFTIVSALVGSIISPKFNRRKFLLFWVIFGIVTSLPIMFFRGESFLVIFAILAGTSFGLGFPTTQAFFADSTVPEERGRVAGLIVLVSFIFVIFSIVPISVLGLESFEILLVILGIKALGFLAFILDPIDSIKSKITPWKDILGSKDFNYYLLAYILFNIAAALVTLLWISTPDIPEYNDAQRLANIFRYIGLGFFAIISGVMADLIGRKKPIILGLIMLGGAYALVGLLTNSTTFFINLLLSGFAWGVLMVVYLVIPGDLSSPGSRERFYAVGWVLPISLYIGINGSARLMGFIPPTDIFSTILSVILFASILPILYAVETLSESKLRERRFREYTKKVGKIVQESKKTD